MAVAQGRDIEVHLLCTISLMKQFVNRKERTILNINSYNTASITLNYIITSCHVYKPYYVYLSRSLSTLILNLILF